jgi:hypothetical protein
MSKVCEAIPLNAPPDQLSHLWDDWSTQFSPFSSTPVERGFRPLKTVRSNPDEGMIKIARDHEGRAIAGMVASS